MKQIKSTRFLFSLFLGFMLPLQARAACIPDTTTAGESVLSNSGYIEYIKGDLPIVISVPHGGILSPADIPDHYGSSTKDAYTQELARRISAEIYAATGHYAHIIINLLHRKKLDANRERGDLAFASGSAAAAQAWDDFHGFIGCARETAEAAYGKSFYIDLHGHSSQVQKIHLGYLLTGSNLRHSDDSLNSADDDYYYINKSSMKNLYWEKYPGDGSHFAELIRGQDSLGELLEAIGFPAMPSLTTPAPLKYWNFYSGGYNTQTHTREGTMSGVQIEVNRSIRVKQTGWFSSGMNTEKIEAFSQALAGALVQYINKWYGIDLAENAAAE